jgi:hypothetical protein
VNIVAKQLRSWFGGSHTNTPRPRTHLNVEQLGERLLPSANMLWDEGVLAGHGQAMAIDINYNIDYAQDRPGQAANFVSTGARGYEVVLGTDAYGHDEFWALDMTGHVMHFNGSGWTETGSPQMSMILAGHGKVFASDGYGGLYQLNDGASSSWHLIPGMQVYGNVNRMSYIQSGANGAESLYVERASDLEVFDYNPTVGTFSDLHFSNIYDLTATYNGAIGADSDGQFVHYLTSTGGWAIYPTLVVNESAGLQMDASGDIFLLETNGDLQEIRADSSYIDWKIYFNDFHVGLTGNLIFGVQTGGGTNALIELNTLTGNQYYMGSPYANSGFALKYSFSAGTGLDGGPELWDVTTNWFGDHLLNEFSNFQSYPYGNQYFVGYLYYNSWMHHPPIILL